MRRSLVMILLVTAIIVGGTVTISVRQKLLAQSPPTGSDTPSKTTGTQAPMEINKWIRNNH